MMKKMMNGLVFVAFSCSVLLVMSSCAKKQVGMEEGVTPSAAVTTAADTSAAKETETAMKESKADTASETDVQDEQTKARLQKEIQVFESENIYFDYDKSDLKSEARAILTKKANWLRKNSGFSVRIEGHCDERGTSEYNLALGERRAESAWKFMNALGISGERLTTVSYGEEKPAASGHNENAWSKNRRDEFRLIQ